MGQAAQVGGSGEREANHDPRVLGDIQDLGRRSRDTNIGLGK